MPSISSLPSTQPQLLPSPERYHQQETLSRNGECPGYMDRAPTSTFSNLLLFLLVLSSERALYFCLVYNLIMEHHPSLCQFVSIIASVAYPMVKTQLVGCKQTTCHSQPSSISRPSRNRSHSLSGPRTLFTSTLALMFFLSSCLEHGLPALDFVVGLAEKVWPIRVDEFQQSIIPDWVGQSDLQVWHWEASYCCVHVAKPCSSSSISAVTRSISVCVTSLFMSIGSELREKGSYLLCPPQVPSHTMQEHQAYKSALTGTLHSPQHLGFSCIITPAKGDLRINYQQMQKRPPWGRVSRCHKGKKLLLWC